MGTFNFKGCEVLDGLSLRLRYEDDSEETYCWEADKAIFDNIVKQDDDFCYFKIEDEPGYYEGFEYNISFEEGWEYNYNYLEDESEKEEVINELKRLKELILKLLDNGMCLEGVGWCPVVYEEQDARNTVEEIINKHIIEVMERPLEEE